MAMYQTEFFGHVTYGSELTYDDVLSREEALKIEATAILSEHGAEFIHFEGLGDALRFQCVFAEGGEKLFHTICEAFAPLMRNGLDGRMLCVDKDLTMVHFYALHDGRWQEAVLMLPVAGFLDVLAMPVVIDQLERKKDKK